MQDIWYKTIRIKLQGTVKSFVITRTMRCLAALLHNTFETSHPRAVNGMGLPEPKPRFLGPPNAGAGHGFMIKLLGRNSVPQKVSEACA